MLIFALLSASRFYSDALAIVGLVADVIVSVCYVADVVGNLYYCVLPLLWLVLLFRVLLLFMSSLSM